MAVAGTLKLSGKAFRVLNCDYEFHQSVDRSGRPNSVPDGGFINVVIESTRDESIVRWMLSYEMQNDGEIIFVDRMDAAMRTIKFSGAYCIYYKEVFDAANDEPMKIHFRATCQNITIDGTSLEKGPLWGASSSGGASASSSSSSSSSGGVSSFNPND